MRNSKSKIKRVGIYLGVSPSDGGMFQYAQSLLEAAISASDSRMDVVVVYANIGWVPTLENLGTEGQQLRNFRSGVKISNILMAMRLPCFLTRIISILLNPLVRELKSYKCDVWVFPAQDSLSWQVFGVKVIGTIHDLMHRYESRFPEVGSFLRYGIREHRFSNIAKYSDVILVDSNIGKKQVVESYHIKPDKVYPLPYIAPSYLSDQKERFDFLAKYKLPLKYLFYPAQFWPHKNHCKLIDALKILSVTYPDISLVLSGGFSNAYENVYNYASSKGVLDRIIFLGYVPQEDLSGIYRRARALVYPTFFGPTNIPPLEAFSLGCPVVVSNIYAMPEQYSDAAIYFDPMDEENMANAIGRVWSSDELVLQMIKKGHKLAENNNQSNFNLLFIDIISKEILKNDENFLNV